MISEILEILNKIQEDIKLDFIVKNMKVPLGIYFLIDNDNIIIYSLKNETYKEDNKKRTKRVLYKKNINDDDFIICDSDKEIYKFKQRYLYSYYLNSNKALNEKNYFNIGFLSLLFKQEKIKKLGLFENNTFNNSLDNVLNYYNSQNKIDIEYINNKINIDIEEYTKHIKENNQKLKDTYLKIFDKHLNNIFNILVVLNNENKIDKSQKYIGIFIDESMEKYKEQLDKYLNVSLFNSDSLENKNNKYISTNYFSFNLNNKKSSLKMSSRKNDVAYKLDLNDLKEFFYFEKICKNFPSTFYIQYDENNKINLDDFKKDINDINKSSCFVITTETNNGNIQIIDFYTINNIYNNINESSYKLFNYLNSYNKKNEIFYLFNELDKLFDYKLKYNLLKKDLKDIKFYNYNQNVLNIFYNNRLIIFNYFYKKRTNKIINEFNDFIIKDVPKILTERREYFSSEKDFSKNFKYNIENDVILYLNILKIINKGEKILKIQKIQEKIKNKILKNNYVEEINNEEFLFQCGMIINLLTKQSVTTVSKQELIKTALNLNSVNKLMDFIKKLDKKYSYKIQYTKYKSLIEQIYIFYNDNKEDILFDDILYLAGFYSDIYFSESKNKEDELSYSEKNANTEIFNDEENNIEIKKTKEIL